MSGFRSNDEIRLGERGQISFHEMSAKFRVVIVECLKVMMV